MGGGNGWSICLYAYALSAVTRKRMYSTGYAGMDTAYSSGTVSISSAAGTPNARVILSSVAMLTALGVKHPKLL